MVAAAAWISVFLYLVPSMVLIVVRSRRDREAWEIALDIPLGIAADLVSVLFLSRLVTLEEATVFARLLWIAGGVGHVAWRARTGRRLPAWPRSVGVRAIATAGVASAFGVWLSAGISRPCINVDRRWHIPLVGSMRGQTAPFHNVYNTVDTLAYHFGGDAMAAQLQALSGDVLHSSFALSIAHDVLFGAAAATLALLLPTRGLRGALVAVLAAAAFLLAGPSTALRGPGGTGFADQGFSYVTYLRLGFRPQVALEGVLLIGFLGAVWARLRRAPGEDPRARVPSGRTWPVLVACAAALSLADEATIGLLGLSLGAAWLVVPNALHPKRLGGVAILGALIAALALPSLVVGGALAPGVAREPFEITPWRIIGFHWRPLLLSTTEGKLALLGDAHSIGLVWLAGVWATLRIRSRGWLAILVMFTSLAAISLVLMMRLQVSKESEEGHRFLTGLMLATPVFGAWWLVRARGFVVPALVVTSLGLSAASTVHWRVRVQPIYSCDSMRAVATEPLNDTSCRARMGAHFGEPTVPEYVSRSLAYWYDGCHPVYAPTSKQKGQHWMVLTGAPITGRAALLALHTQMLRPDQTLRVTCPPNGEDDKVCAFALQRGRCAPRNEAAVTCELSPAERETLLRDARLE